MFARMVGLPVLVAAVNGKIAFLLRPFPIVDISAEGRDTGGRRRHDAQVPAGLVERKVILLPGPHLAQAGFQTGGFLVACLHQVAEFAHSGADARPFERVPQRRHFVRDVQYFAQEIGGLALHRQFFFARISPEALPQVIVQGVAQRVEVRIGAVVVGNQQSVLRHYRPGTAEVQGDDGVAQRHARLVINRPGRELQPLALHILHQGAGQGVHHPHSLVGAGGETGGKRGNDANNQITQFHF